MGRRSRSPLEEEEEEETAAALAQQDTSMVWLICPMASLLSEWVQALGRPPSTELALVSEAVRERARRVMLAEGTVDRQEEHQHLDCGKRQEQRVEHVP